MGKSITSNTESLLCSNTCSKTVLRVVNPSSGGESCSQSCSKNDKPCSKDDVSQVLSDGMKRKIYDKEQTLMEKSITSNTESLTTANYHATVPKPWRPAGTTGVVGSPKP